MSRKGVVLLYKVDEVVLGVACHSFVNLTLYFMSVGCVRLVFTREL